jgi:Fic family protein
MKMAHIHPYIDGNGRIARLVEKCFLSKHIGNIAWYLPLEQLYFENRKEYYTNLNIGPNFKELDYDKAIDFLLMSGMAFEKNIIDN